MVKNYDLDSSVRDYCVENYADDELVYSVDPDCTFQDVVDALNNGESVYDTIGIGDSVIREYVFAGLSEVTGISGRDIYNSWVLKTPLIMNSGSVLE